jgi:hypothetical protein
VADSFALESDNSPERSAQMLRKSKLERVPAFQSHNEVSEQELKDKIRQPRKKHKKFLTASENASPNRRGFEIIVPMGLR